MKEFGILFIVAGIVILIFNVWYFSDAETNEMVLERFIERYADIMGMVIFGVFVPSVIIFLGWILFKS